MFCARCGTPITGPAKACLECGLDLFLAGAVRLTDPLGAAHWTEDRALVIRPPEPLSPVTLDAGRKPARSAEAPMAEEVRTWLEADAPAIETPETPEPDAREEFPFPVDHDDSHHESSVFIIGGEDHDDPRWLPWVIVTMIAVISVALIGVTLAALNLANRSPEPEATPSASVRPSAKPTASATTSTSRKPSPSASSPKVRPTFPPNATKCSATLAASMNASCGLAGAVAAELAEDPTATKLTATSPVSGRSYTFECVTDAMTICKVGNVTVYVIVE